MSDMLVVHSVTELREVLSDWRAQGQSIGLVPTMGALHEGHLSLVREARAATDKVVATIFVNPKQFSPGEDLDAYPRTLGRDSEMLRAEGCALLFAPKASEIYPDGFATEVRVSGLTEVLCGATRKNFFTGIATVVAKLFILTLPNKAFFGEKDYQQLLVVRRMAADLGLPVEVIGCPLVREKDGLAMSSRNRYLSTEERQQALTLYHTLKELSVGMEAGADVPMMLAAGLERLKAAGFQMDYLELRDAADLTPMTALDRPARLLAGGYLGKTRLIDNMPVLPKA